MKALMKLIVAFKAIPKLLGLLVKGAVFVLAVFGLVKGAEKLKEQDADILWSARLKNLVK